MGSIIQLYKSAFGGLSPAAWMLALVILINRSGTMVIPFLSVYLVSSLGFSLVEAGWIMTMFGIGAIGGSLLGGWLTDKIGPFKVQLISLTGGGLMFLMLSRITTFYPLAIFIFFVSLVSEMLRPANQLAVASYAKPENVTRAISLNRMAINLGFSLGPAIGGLLAAVSYQLLFLADAVTCIGAAIIFFLYFYKKQGREQLETAPIDKERSPWKDIGFLGFISFVILFALLFFQIFTTWPIYHRQVFLLPETQIGLLLALNGLIVFLFEMVIVFKLGDRIAPRKLIAFGGMLMAIAFLIIYGSDHVASLYLACIFISFAEIFAMPFMVTFTVNRSGKTNKGAYMGLYAMGFASAFALAPLVGTNMVDQFGFKTWWLVAGGVSVLISIFIFFMLNRKPKLVT
ncbi:MAG: MFS transporter [Cyclobacteriaceae bacterium]